MLVLVMDFAQNRGVEAAFLVERTGVKASSSGRYSNNLFNHICSAEELHYDHFVWHATQAAHLVCLGPRNIMKTVHAIVKLVPARYITVDVGDKTTRYTLPVLVYPAVVCHTNGKYYFQPWQSVRNESVMLLHEMKEESSQLFVTADIAYSKARI